MTVQNEVNRAYWEANKDNYPHQACTEQRRNLKPGSMAPEETFGYFLRVPLDGHVFWGFEDLAGYKAFLGYLESIQMQPKASTPCDT